ncbi:MAG: hypothetical protein SOY88_00210 [Massilioclostridium sp.]|nr:hypothetical protein [Massilioclostridium sp.]
MPEKKIGRPTTNPKGKPIHVRLDIDSENILDSYCNQNSITRAEAIRRGIKKLEADIKK